MNPSSVRRLIGLGLLCLTGTVRPAAAGVAEPFLQNGVGGRSAALSDCYVAVADGPFGSWYNPAGPLSGAGLELGYQYEAFGLETSHNTLAGRWPVGPGVMNAMLDLFSYGTVDKRDASGALTGETLALADSLLQFGYGLRLGDAWRLGVNTGIYTVDLGAEKWSGLVADLGGMWLPGADWTVGATFKNLGTGRAEHKPPTSLRTGASYAVFGRRWLLSAEVELPLAGTFTELGLGTEFRLWDWLDLRLGWRRPLAGGEPSADGISLGLGFNFGGFGLDLSFQGRGDFGVRNSLTLVYAFGHPRAVPLAAPAAAASAAPEPAVPEPVASEPASPGLAVPVPHPLEQAEFHYKAGQEYERFGRYVDAIVEYKAALRLKPEDAKVQQALKGATERAKKEVTDPERQTPSPVQASVLKSIRKHYELGLEAYTARNYTTAIRELKLVLELDAQYREATELLDKVRATMAQELAGLRKQAETAREADDLPREINAYQRMLALDPGNEETAAQLRTARQKVPKRVESLYLTGVDLYARGQYREALKTFEAVLDLDPGHAKSKDAVQKIKEKLLQTGQ